VESGFHFGPGDAEREACAIDNSPALAIGSLVKFVGLARSVDSPVGACARRANRSSPS
jgi:hypothetical protein